MSTFIPLKSSQFIVTTTATSVDRRGWRVHFARSDFDLKMNECVGYIVSESLFRCQGTYNVIFVRYLSIGRFDVVMFNFIHHW